MSDLVEFLRARLDEDERIARAAIADDNGQDAANLIRATAIPRRVLAEVAAKREIIRLYEDTISTIEMFKSHGREAKAHEAAAEAYLNVIRAHAAVYCGGGHHYPRTGPAQESDCSSAHPDDPSLRILAYTWRYDPGWKQEWRP